jgi:hypothetical protein
MFTTRPRTPIVSPKFSSMTSNEVPGISLSSRETSTEQSEGSLADQRVVASTEAASSRDAEFDCESQPGESRDSEAASDNSGHLKVVAVAALATIVYDFGQSLVTKTRLTSMESCAHYFLKGYDRALGAESMSEPRANEVVVFENFFATRLWMSPHLILVEILRKF